MRKLSALPLLLVLPLAAVSAAPAPERAASIAAPAARAASSAAACRSPRATFALGGPAAPRARKLGEQPPANHYLAVARQVGGCAEPAIVRTGISG
jgi:hypothetical protein